MLARIGSCGGVGAGIWWLVCCGIASLRRFSCLCLQLVFDIINAPAFCSSLWAEGYGGEELGARVARVREDCTAMLHL